MFKNLKLGTKIIAGYLLLIVFIVITGYVGYWGTDTVATSLRIVGDEEAPVIDMANEMKLALMVARNTMEEFKGASAALASDDEQSLDGIEKAYRQSLEDFDTFADAILQGATLENGTVVIQTDNDQLADLVRQSDQLHNEKFQVAATEMMQAGRDLLARKVEADAAMEEMEGVYDEVMSDAGNVEKLISGEIAARAKNAQLGEQALSILREEVPLADMANELKIAMAETRIALEEFIQTSDTQALDEIEKRYHEKVANFDLCVVAILDGAEVDGTKVIATDNDDIRAAIEELDQNHTDFQARSKELMAAQRAMVAQAQAADVAMAKLDRFGEEADLLLDQVELAAGKEMAAAKAEGAAAASTSITWILVSLVTAVAVGMSAGVLITRSITKPINRIIEGLSSGADQTTSAAGQVSGAGQSLAQGASEQAASVEEISSSIEESSSMTKQNAANAAEAKTLAATAQSGAEKGAEAMTRMSAAIDDIKKSSDETAKIVKTIDEIAFQTNLLALNAAVEAARAGDAGKGFAVVAEEVRNLSQRSAEAARNTADMIEGAVKNADNGVQISKEVGEALQEIAEGSRKVNDLVGEIASASDEQAQGVEQISTAVTQMDTVTQSNASNAEESASAAEELSAQAEELKSMVAELQAIVGGSTATNGQAATSAKAQKHVDTGAHHDVSQRIHQRLQANQQPKAKESTAEKLIPMDADADVAAKF